jgi:protein gp37
MAENSKIEWTDHTFNPWEGCQKVGPGCDNCYAEARNARFGGGIAPNWGPGAARRRTSASNWRKPLQWDAEAAANGIRYRVFCSSLADVFDNAVNDEWRVDLAHLIIGTPNLDWLLLTKRVGNARAMLWDMFGDMTAANVWIGATIVNQEEADRDIPKLLGTPAAKRFLSMEPLLGPVDLTAIDFGSSVVINVLTGGGRDDLGERGTGPKLDWVIVGGESGKNARITQLEWERSICDQCARAGTPFLFKQHGEWIATSQIGFHGHEHCQRIDIPPQSYMRVGKRVAGRHLDGFTHDGFPVTVAA